MNNERVAQILMKVAQGGPDPMMDPMAGGAGMGMPMGADPMAGGAPMGGPPPPPSPEEAMMMAGGMPGMPAPMIPGAIPGMEGGVDKDKIIEQQSNAIGSLAQTVETMTDMHATLGNDSEQAAENIAATLAGTGVLNSIEEEEFPLIEEPAPEI